MQNFYKLIGFLLILSVCFSCDNRWVFKGENIPPELGLKLTNGQFTDDEGNLLISLSDTLKLNAKTTTEVYTFDMKYFDDNLVEITYEILSGNGALIQLNVEEQMQGKIDISQDEVSLEYKPEELGEHEIRFIATDAFGESSGSVTVRLFFFDNWAPIGNLAISYQGKTDERHYLIDASESVDEDAAYGGYLVQYKYKVEDYELLTTVPSINYIFQSSGTYNVSLQVLDNDNVWSEEITEEVVVE